MKNLTIEEKIRIFKILVISKIIHLASVTVLPNSTITELRKIHKDFNGHHKRPKSKKKKKKKKTLIDNFDTGGLKDVNISPKITSV